MLLPTSASRIKLDTDFKVVEISALNVPPTEKERDKVTKISLKKQVTLKRISESFFEALKNITTVEIEQTGLKSLPPGISALAQLEELLLPNNHIKMLPPTLGDFKKLKKLNLESNKLMDLPASIGKLASLKSLNVSRNRLVALPLEMGQLSLKEFDASLNPLLSPHITVLRGGWEETKKHLNHLAKVAAQNPIEKRPKTNKLEPFITDDSIGLQGKNGVELNDKVKWYTKRAPELSIIVESAQAEHIGRRQYMEDRWAKDVAPLKDPDSNITAYIFGVYDGHGGAECCDFIKEHLHKTIIAQPEFKYDTLDQALSKGYVEFEANFIANAKKKRWEAGSTAVTVIIAQNKMVYGWLGDCRAVIVDSVTGVRITNDHTPKVPEEKARVLALPGGKCELDEAGVPRVQGKVCVTRAFGDILLKLPTPYLTAVPETKVMMLNPRHQFIVLGSDGLHEWVQPQFAADALKKNGIGALQTSADQFIKKTRDCNGRDNACALVIALNWVVTPAPYVPEGPLKSPQPSSPLARTGSRSSATFAGLLSRKDSSTDSPPLQRQGSRSANGSAIQANNATSGVKKD